MSKTYRYIFVTVKRSRSKRSPWRCEWRGPDGRRHGRDYPTRDIAEAARRYIESDLNSWLPQLDARGRPLHDVLRNFHASLADKSDAHQKDAKAIIDGFVTHVNAQHVGDFTTAAVERYMVELAERPAATRCKVLRYLRLFGGWCVRQGFMPTNPAAGVKPPRQPHRLKTLPTEAEWVRLLWACHAVEVDDRQGMYVLILLAVVTGIRADTLLSIGRGHFELPAPGQPGPGLLTVVEPKTDREDCYGLPPIVAQYIGIRFRQVPPCASTLFRWRVFPRKGWDRVKREANLPDIRFHDLRAVAGLRAAVAAAIRAGGQALRHTSSGVYAAHYADRRAIELAAAESVRLPELPDLPPFSLIRLPKGRSTHVWSGW